jgi:hypothetical protein
MVHLLITNTWGNPTHLTGPDRAGRWKFAGPKSSGRFRLELRPVVKYGRPLAQIRRRSWGMFSRTILEVSCRDEAWLRPDAPIHATLAQGESRHER